MWTHARALLNIQPLKDPRCISTCVNISWNSRHSCPAVKPILCTIWARKGLGLWEIPMNVVAVTKNALGKVAWVYLPLKAKLCQVVPGSFMKFLHPSWIMSRTGTPTLKKASMSWNHWSQQNDEGRLTTKTGFTPCSSNVVAFCGVYCGGLLALYAWHGIGALDSVVPSSETETSD